MSTLGGILNFDGQPVDERVLVTMSNALASNGPDAGGQHTSGSIGMVHRAFCTNKESYREQQPLVTDEGQILVWDGRLDNRTELLHLLRNRLGVEETDLNIVMEAYREWGVKFPAKLVGDFALSLWEPRTRTLLLARDHAGPRPIFYHRNGDEFLWASELRVLLALRGSQLEVNDEFVAAFLSHQITHSVTPYRGVHAVLPGHVVTVRDGEVKTERFWGPDANYEIRYRTDEEYEEHFRQLFRDAVRCRMRVEGPVWTALSGGLDSSAITCMAHESLRAVKVQRRTSRPCRLFTTSPAVRTNATSSSLSKNSSVSTVFMCVRVITRRSALFLILRALVSPTGLTVILRDTRCCLKR